MADDDIIEYINNKKDLITDDYRVKYFVEFLFYKGQDKVYENQVTQLEKKLLSADNGSNAIQIKKFLNTDPFKNAKREGLKAYHLANINGFIGIDSECEYCIKTEKPSASDKSDNFLSAFEKIIKNPELLPSKSVILLNQSKHHMIRCNKRKYHTLTNTPSKRKLKSTAAEGSKKITDFFPVTKSLSKSSESDFKEDPVPEFKYRVEELINEHRKNDDIKILWIPKNHSELDAGGMVSIHFCNMISQILRDNKITEDSAIRKTFSIFPSQVWKTLLNHVQEFETFFKNRNQNEDDEEFILDEPEEDEEEEENNNEQ